MKISSILMASTGVLAAQWEQPSYWEVFDAVKGRSANTDWGFPTGVRASAPWAQCPALTVPAGADNIACDASTCAVICKAGYKSFGQRRTRCRWNKTQGFFWKKTLGTCTTCDPETPAVTDTNVTLNCSINRKNKHVCQASCPTGMAFPGGKAGKSVKVKCKCPRKAGSCGWVFKKTTATSFGALTCSAATGGGGGTATTASPVTTAAPGTTAAITVTMPTVAPGTTAAITVTLAPTTTDANAFTIAKCETALAGNADASEICAVIENVNADRIAHQVAPFVVPDPSLCEGAQTWAQTNADANSMFHSTDNQRPGLGENLAVGSAMTMQLATTLWQNEDAFWNFDEPTDCLGIDTAAECLPCVNSTPSGTPIDCLHFTQQMWKDTTAACYGKAVGTDGKTYVVARYTPTGNVLGNFHSQVLPKLT